MFLPFLLASAVVSSPVIQTRPPVAGDMLAGFTMGDFEYKPGRATVLTVWAYWCDTWKTQDQRMAEARKATKGMPVDFLAISIDGRWTDLTQPPTWARLLTDRGAEWSKRLHIDRVPYTFVVGPDGTIRWAKDGVVRVADVLTALRKEDSEASGSVYLTFDDFPSGKRSDHDLLDLLRAQDVHASFFCIGDNVKAHKDIAKRAAREGHSLEVHGFHHTGEVAPLKCAELIDTVTSFKSQWLRPPGKSGITSLDGKTPFVGSVINPYDYRRPGSAEMLRRILNRLRGGSVIQLHAGVAETLDVLPEVFEQVRKRNFTIEPIPH